MRALLCLLAMGGLLGLEAHGQALPTNERGQVAFYEMVPADTLGGRLVATHAFGVYDRGYISKKLHGKMQYQLTVEVENGRYRQQFTDFVFAYYHLERDFYHAAKLRGNGYHQPAVGSGGLQPGVW